MIMAIIFFKELFVMTPDEKISKKKRRKIEKCLDKLQEHLDDFCVRSERIDIAQKINSFRRLVRRYSIE